MRQFRRPSPALIAAVCAAAGVLALPVSATAQQTAFAGSCQFKNASLDFLPGLKLASASHTDTLSASGSCGSAGAGNLTGTVTGPASCVGGQAPATGSGTLTVGSSTIPVKITFDIKLPNGTLTISGMDAGSASGTAEFVNLHNLGEMPGCVGQGLTSATFDATIQTSSTLVSGTTTTTHKRRHHKR